jgi:hypothetical protein
MRQASRKARKRKTPKTIFVVLINEARGQRAAVKKIHVWPYFQT